MIVKKVDLEKMPPSCSLCNFCDESITLHGGTVTFQYLSCGLSFERIFSHAPENAKSQRAPNCPLFEK